MARGLTRFVHFSFRKLCEFIPWYSESMMLIRNSRHLNEAVVEPCSSTSCHFLRPLWG